MNDTRPSFNSEIAIKMPEVPEVKHNLNELEDFAVALNNYYTNLIFTEDNINEAAKEKASVNKLIEKVKRMRIDSVKEFKKPIDDFESTAKRVEKLLTEASNSIKAFTDAADDARRKEKYEKTIKPLIQLACSEAFNKGYFITEEDIEVDQRWYNKTYSDEEIEKDLELQVSNFIIAEETMRKDIEVIKSFNNPSEEMYIERYKHTRDLAGIINDIKASQKVDNTSMFDIPKADDSFVTATFRGTETQMLQLKLCARGLGMEVI